ncbi:head-tail connector protein [Arvimicrobium flavum]|uniref:head-tail connector protein n=1 Tax=Arvimicrobium flavum TaxID=3393320 RepID=UPI00237A1EFD|nr:head-tail connector protein [Mesorhizobium shangrilense]
MTLFRTVEPAVEPVTLAEAKAHLRLDHDSEDGLVSGLIRAARDEVERSTGLALIDQTWRLVLDRWPRSGCAAITKHPVKAILSVTAYGPDGEASLVDPGTYQFDGLSRPARLHLEADTAPLRAMNGIEVDFSAGFGESGPDVPDLLKRTILLLVAHWFEFRGTFGPGDQPVSFPVGYERMISGYRTRRL